MYGDTWAVTLNTLKPSNTVWHSYHLPKRMSNAFLALFLYVSVINHFYGSEQKDFARFIYGRSLSFYATH